jgi:copper chaperone CopZ
MAINRKPITEQNWCWNGTFKTGENMKNFIRSALMSLLFFGSLAHSAYADTSVYSIRVDGLACPYCAYGIEKKLNQINGVKFIDMDLDKGIVTVETNDVKLEDAQLKQLFQDSGFTYRSKKVSTR